MVNNKGFSLVELIIYVSITIIISNIMIFSLGNTESKELKTIASQLQSDLRLIQRLAVIKNTTFRFRLDKNKNTYELAEDTGDFLNMYSTFKTVDLPNKLNIESVYKDHFYTINGASKSTSDTIALYSDNYVVKITINVGPGRIDITEFRKI